MKISKIDHYFEDNSVVLKLSKADKKSILEDMLLSLAVNNKIQSRDVPELLANLLERERLGSTGLGRGIAIPHIEHPCVTDVFIAIGRSKNGVDWDSMDRKPTHFIFLVIGPKFSKGNFSLTLAYIAHLLKNDPIRDKLIRCKLEDILDVIRMVEYNKLSIA